MNETKLKRLLELFCDSGVAELEMEYSFWRGPRIRISRQGRQTWPGELETSGTEARPPAVSPVVPEEENAHLEPLRQPVEDEEILHIIHSPMVGSFFLSSSPEAEMFVKEGDRVRVGQTVCIIEAMKIMNEVVSDVEGEVVAILAENADPVEFNQALFKIRPSS